MAHYPIVIFGEALVDMFKDNAVVGGAPFNVARHLAGLGMPPLFISAIGRDNGGVLIQQELDRFQMDYSCVQVNQYHTGFVQVHESAQGHEFEIMSDCAYDMIDASEALVSISSLIHHKEKSNNLLYHGTLGLRNQRSREAFQLVSEQLATNPNLQVFLDINWRAGHVDVHSASQYLSEANIIKVSIDELEMILHWFHITALVKYELPKTGVLNPAISLLMQHLMASLLLVTFGDLGSACFNNAGQCLASSQALKHQKIVDTVGAGDAFSSVMLLAIYHNWPLEIALHRANEFAADVCGIRGATPSDLAFYTKYINSWRLQKPLHASQ